MCTFKHQPETSIPRPLPQPYERRRGIRDPNVPKERPSHLPRYDLQDAPAPIDPLWDGGPYAPPSRPQRPDADTYVPRGAGLKRPDHDPRFALLFARPSVPHVLVWNEMSGPPSAYAARTPSPRPNTEVLAWAMALRHGGSPLTIREDDRPGEALVANWPTHRRRTPSRISAPDALRGAEEIRLRILRTRVVAVVRRGPLSFFVTVALGEIPGRPARFTPAGAILPESARHEARRLLRDAGLLSGSARRFDAALERYHAIEDRIRHHVALAKEAAAHGAWPEAHAELLAANDVAAPLRHQAAAIRLGPALDPGLYGDPSRPPVRRRDAEAEAKAILGRLQHAARKLRRTPPPGPSMEVPIAAE